MRALEVELEFATDTSENSYPATIIITGAFELPTPEDIRAMHSVSQIETAIKSMAHPCPGRGRKAVRC